MSITAVVVLTASESDVHGCPLSGIAAFPVAGGRLWNSLPPDVTSAAAPTVFRKRLRKRACFAGYSRFRFLLLANMMRRSGSVPYTAMESQEDDVIRERRQRRYEHVRENVNRHRQRP